MGDGAFVVEHPYNLFVKPPLGNIGINDNICLREKTWDNIQNVEGKIHLISQFSRSISLCFKSPIVSFCKPATWKFKLTTLFYGTCNPIALSCVVKLLKPRDRKKIFLWRRTLNWNNFGRMMRRSSYAILAFQFLPKNRWLLLSLERQPSSGLQPTVAHLFECRMHKPDLGYCLALRLPGSSDFARRRYTTQHTFKPQLGFSFFIF